MRTLLFALMTLAVVSFSFRVANHLNESPNTEESVSIVIQCDDVEPATELLPEMTTTDILSTTFQGAIEASSKMPKKMVYADFHPFMKTIEYAYKTHRPISISPDMVWLMISQGFAIHVDQNAEALRDQFVAHEGKKKITVVRWHWKKGNPNNDWEGVFPEFADSIKTYVGDKLHSAVTQKFTTSTPASQAAFQISLMDAMSSYFEYVLLTPSCGIPEITLEGSPEDWQAILDRAKELRQYDLDWWIDELEPVLEEFVAAANGNPNIRFWKDMYAVRTDAMNVVCTTVSIDYIQGWATKFFPYINNYGSTTRNPYIDKKKAELSKEHFTSGVSEVDFKWDHRVDGVVYEMKMIAGFVGISQHPRNLTLRPEIAWIVKDANE